MRITAIGVLLLCSVMSRSISGYAMENENLITSLRESPELAIPLLTAQIQELDPIRKKVVNCTSFEEKLAFVSSLPQVKKFFADNRDFEAMLQDMPAQYGYVIKAVVAIGQGPVIFCSQVNQDDMKSLVDTLWGTERFYSYMGGLVGYHVKTLELMLEQLSKKQPPDPAKLFVPPVTDIRTDTPDRKQMVVDGLNSLGAMAEIYVVGGAGDRLALVDEKTKMPLPVARLDFAGCTLLESLVKDLEAREHLSYRLTGKQSYTPIILMTSLEKRNDEQIGDILESSGYFGRPKASIYRLLQPLTPVIAIDGKWAVSSPCELVLKPGGHGVVWKLADEFGAFNWLTNQNRSFCLVRQINNPLAGLDANLLALGGFGSKNTKAFGFESVPRLPNMSEGMNVLKETQDNQTANCTISNIEYTEFAKAKASDPAFASIADSPDFPANTNILFADIARVKEASTKLPVPGFLVNMKHPVETLRDGKKVVLPGARLESTMQNIADAITNSYQMPVSPDKLEILDTFVLLNDRAKTMSVTKKACDGKSIQETPEGCFYDLMQENARMLQNACGFTVASMNTPQEYLANGPSVLVTYHPALGPLYSIIGQKIQKGTLHAGSELDIQAQEVNIRSLDVDGSLRIIADCVTGAKNEKTGLLEFSPSCGSIVLENVTVKNKGIDRSAKNSYFKSQILRTECANIRLLGNSELIAKNVTLDGNVNIEVQPNTRAILCQDKEGKLAVLVEDIQKPHPDSLRWEYSLDADNNIVLKRCNRDQK